MKILSTQQVREADANTIKNEPINSVDLMERAAIQLFYTLIELYPEPIKFIIFAGPGNNGGDGIALARMLVENAYPVDLYIMDLKGKLSPDAAINENRLPVYSWLKTARIKEAKDIPSFESGEIVIDALFGSGLSRPLSGLSARLVEHINRSTNVISIDIPSGLFGEDNSANPMKSVIRAKYTLSLQCPKMAFVMPENAEFVGEWKVLPIGIDAEYIDKLDSDVFVITKEQIKKRQKKRTKFDHKGDFGHALLIAGSPGKYGAASLSAYACMKSGVGLLTCHVPADAQTAIHSYVPEAMLSTKLPDISPFSAIGIGPGLGTGDEQTKLLEELIAKAKCRLVLDADAINILANKPELIELLPEETILTPHPGEYKRLFGNDPNQYERIYRLKSICNKRKLIVVLKGAHTAVVLSDGKVWFNNTGNPGMATAGSGDVLTGLILSLLAQGYSPADAACLAIFLHGSAGQIASQKHGEESLIARDIVENLGNAFIELG